MVKSKIESMRIKTTFNISPYFMSIPSRFSVILANSGIHLKARVAFILSDENSFCQNMDRRVRKDDEKVDSNRYLCFKPIEYVYG